MLITVNIEIHVSENIISGDRVVATEALRNGLALSFLKETACCRARASLYIPPVSVKGCLFLIRVHRLNLSDSRLRSNIRMLAGSLLDRTPARPSCWK